MRLLPPRDRIQGAIAELLNTGAFPSGITARRKALVGYGISQSTLSKHVDLWHPDHLSDGSTNELHPEDQVFEDSPILELLPSAELQPAATNKLSGLAFGPAPLGQGPKASSYEAGGMGGFPQVFQVIMSRLRNLKLPLFGHCLSSDNPRLMRRGCSDI